MGVGAVGPKQQRQVCTADKGDTGGAFGTAIDVGFGDFGELVHAVTVVGTS